MSEGAPRAGGEAARLLAAAQDWLATAAPDLAPVDEEGRTCPCPVCRAIAVVRDLEPDEVGRWVDAAVAGLGAALRDGVPHDEHDPSASHEESDREPDEVSGEVTGTLPPETPGAVGEPRIRRIEVRTDDLDGGSDA